MNTEQIYIISILNTGISKVFPRKHIVKQFEGRIIGNKTASGEDQFDKWPTAKSIRKKQIIIQIVMIALFIIGCTILAFPVR